MTADDDLYWYDDATYQGSCDGQHLCIFHFYYPHTKEIKNGYAYKTCLAYSAFLTFLLPLFVALHQRRLHHRKKRLHEAAAAAEAAVSSLRIPDDEMSDIKESLHTREQTEKVYRSRSAPERFLDRLMPYGINYVYSPSISAASGWKSPLSKSDKRDENNNQDEGFTTIESIPEDAVVELAHPSSDDDYYMDVDNITDSGSSFGGSSNASGSSPDITIDLLRGPRPWYCFYCSCKFWQKIRKCATWDEEMKNIVKLALPYTVSTIIENVFDLLEAGVVGRQLGTANLSAYYTVDMALGFASMFLYGVMSSLTVLVSHALGAGNNTLAGIYVQLSVWTHQIFFLPILIIGWKYFDQVVLWLGFDEDLAAMAQEYARFKLLDQAVGIYNTALYYVLEVSGHERYSTAINGIHSATSFIIVLTVATRREGTRLATIGAIHLGLTIIFSVLNVSILLYKKWFHGFWRGMFCTNPFRELGPIGTFIRAAIPLSCGYVIEYCEWDVLFVFAALQGPAGTLNW